MMTVKKIALYRIKYEKGNKLFDIYLEAYSAQDAVNMTRESEHHDPAVNILEVARVVNTWK